MGVCVSTPVGCLGGPLSSSEKKGKKQRSRNRKKTMKRSLDRVDESATPDRSSHNSGIQVTLATSVEEAWFDSSVALESDGDEDFLSVQDDVLSLNGLDGAFISCIASPADAHNDEKGRSLGSSPSSARRKASSKLSFKFNVSSKMLLQRPVAGCLVPFYPIEKKILDSWSSIEPSTFRVRGDNYLRDKKKEFASNYAAYYPFGVDLFLSPKKIDNIARFVKLPIIESSGEVPSILVVNAQIPVYPASLFQNETDGEGFNIVLYFKLSESYSKELSFHFQENFRKLIDDEEEKVKGFPTGTIVPFRERLKILGRVVNVDDLPLNAAERKLMHAYNGKPLLSRPQHKFFLGENYFEIDLDMHRFSYISRKGFDTFLDRLKLCILDFGLTIQGNKTDELPEQILCCIRLNGIDYMNYQQLGLSQESLGYSEQIL